MKINNVLKFGKKQHRSKVCDCNFSTPATYRYCNLFDALALGKYFNVFVKKN